MNAAPPAFGVLPFLNAKKQPGQHKGCPYTKVIFPTWR